MLCPPIYWRVYCPFELFFSKTYPSFLTVKEGSTSHLGLLPSGKKRETALLGAQNRYVLRLADHQRSTPSCAGWDRLAIGGDYLRNCLAYEGYNDNMMLVLW